jgi:SAM-dependent methyltransferase
MMSDDVFRLHRTHNRFDDLAIDVNGLYAAHPIGPSERATTNDVPFAASPFHAIYRSRLIPLSSRRRLWRLARQTGVDTSWFLEFSTYWSSVLGGRPLWGPQDFYFLKNLYRVRFQDNAVPDTDDARTHVAAWQRPELLYQLLHLVGKESLRDELAGLIQVRRHGGRIRSILEFGCATAPVVTSLFEFYPPDRRLEIFISDIQTLAFHYGCYKFRRCSNVRPVLLVPEHDCLLQLPATVDVVFCLTVFEHLNRPLKTAERLRDALNPGGFLVFDYIKGDGEGLDTVHAVRERDAVLDYITEHFDILSGPLDKRANVGLTIARRR